jgi:hypothetical protein
MPKSATAWAGVSYFFPISTASYGTLLAALAAGGSMAEQWKKEDPDSDSEVSGAIETDEVRGRADEDADEADEFDEEDLDDEEDDEENTTF